MALVCYLIDNAFLDYIPPFWKNISDQKSKFNLETWLYLIISNITIVGQETALFLGLDNRMGQLYFTQNFHQNKPAGQFVYAHRISLDYWY